MARAVVECAQCGQADDHPKAHIGFLDTGEAAVESKHHDCLSVRDKELLFGSAQAEGSGPKASAIVEACEGGLRGDDLLAAIQGKGKRKLAQAEGLHAKEAAK